MAKTINKPAREVEEQGGPVKPDVTKAEAIHSFNVINGINEDRRMRSVADQVLGQAVEASLKVIAEYINKH
jgi:hypothetical protein